MDRRAFLGALGLAPVAAIAGTAAAAPQFATGGVVTPRAMGIGGEDGPEAILPASRRVLNIPISPVVRWHKGVGDA